MRIRAEINCASVNVKSASNALAILIDMSKSYRADSASVSFVGVMLASVFALAANAVGKGVSLALNVRDSTAGIYLFVD